MDSEVSISRNAMGKNIIMANLQLIRSGAGPNTPMASNSDNLFLGTTAEPVVPVVPLEALVLIFCNLTEFGTDCVDRIGNVRNPCANDDIAKLSKCSIICSICVYTMVFLPYEMLLSIKILGFTNNGL